MKFLVISSDVIYPAGSMKNYETRFWLPFQGVLKPVYAIHGNHDWYDALEGFSATFFTPDMARAVITARAAADLNISSTDSAHADELVSAVDRLRSFYRVPTQNQRAPYFQIWTSDFALIAIDTGVARSLNKLQYDWLERALLAAKGKFIMVVLGHPFYAGGSATAAAGSAFDKLHRLLQDSGIRVVMAGDTHDLEYCHEENAGDRIVYHFVNGGGGAYLSFGTALSWPRNRCRNHGTTTQADLQSSRRSTVLRHASSGHSGYGQRRSMDIRSTANGCLRHSTTTQRRSSRVSSKCGWSGRRTACGPFHTA